MEFETLRVDLKSALVAVMSCLPWEGKREVACAEIGMAIARNFSGHGRVEDAVVHSSVLRFKGEMAAIIRNIVPAGLDHAQGDLLRLAEKAINDAVAAIARGRHGNSQNHQHRSVSAKVKVSAAFFKAASLFQVLARTFNAGII